MNVESVSKMNAISMDVEVDDAVDDMEDDVVVAIKFFTFKITKWII